MVINREYLFWLLQGLIPGAISGYYLMGIFLYFGPLLLIALLITALTAKNIKKKLRIWGFIVSATISFFTFVYIPTGVDVDNANKVGKYIESRYGKFDNRTHVDETHKGKIFYNSPGKYPTIIFYEIVDPKDIQDIETFARESLDKYSLYKVKLVFYEKQNWHGEPGKAGSRGFEFASKKIVITK
ncbi:MAG: hypothetical protein WC405_12620 [Syntrophales bacterium]